MRILLADDEPVALDRLELAVAGVAGASVVVRARNGREALNFIRELRPDIAVLDIDMPLLDGFAVVESLQATDPIPEIVFVTAHHQHAIRAFELHAVDYLLKPVAFDRFREALRRARERLDARAADARFDELQTLIATLKASLGEQGAFERELWVRNRNGLVRVPVETIDYISADGDYVTLHCGNASHLLKDTIASLHGRLDPRHFARVHRSTIVRTANVQALQRRGARGMLLLLEDGTRLAVGPNYADAALTLLGARRWK